MKITINNIESVPEYITIRRSEYIELKSKADRFEKRSTASKNNIKSLNAQRTPKERHELAQKAAQARWSRTKLKTEIQSLYNELPNLETNLEELCNKLKKD